MNILNIFIIIVCFIILVKSRLYTTYNLTVSLSQNPLPISIESISGIKHLDRVRVVMSHLEQKRDGFFASASITAYLYNSTALNRIQLDAILILLQLSRDKRFNFYELSEKAIIISDPNDKPCTQHLEHYFKYFFPCNNYATLSLDQLINIDQLFRNQLYFEMDWHLQKEQLNLIIIFPSQKQLSSQIKRQGSCGSIFITQNQQSSISTDMMLEEQTHVDYSLMTINQWYNPSKCMVHLIKKAKNSYNVLITTYLPASFHFERYQLHPPSPVDANFTHVQGGLLLQFKVAMDKQVQELAVILYVRATMPPFEEFETVGAGGEQIMNIALVEDLPQLKRTRLNSALASLKLLEPDFSLPFKVITFTFAIIGYLWVNLWRIHKTSLEQ